MISNPQNRNKQKNLLKLNKNITIIMENDNMNDL